MFAPAFAGGAPMHSILFFCLFLFATVSAQSSTSSSSSSSSSLSATPTSRNASVVLTTSSFTTTSVSHSGNTDVNITSVLPTVFNVTITPTSTISTSATTSASTTPTPAPIVLATKLDPAFGVLGAILILTGLPSAFWGHKNRWTSFFLIGFYTLSLVCIVLVLKFGVLPAINPPSKTLRGMFVLASAVAGFAGGAIAIFFWKSTKYFIGAWGGFALGLWIQCFRDGGLIRVIGFRWIMYMGCAVVGFVLCTIPKLHYYILLVSTAFVGASAFMLGVDCFTTAGLKEFYIWNLGFRSLYPKFSDHNIEFPVTQTMQIELGLLGAVALMGIAVQLRVLSVLQLKLREIEAEQKKRDEEAEIMGAQHFAGMEAEREQWEFEHPTLGKHGRMGSEYSGMPLIRDDGSSATPDPSTPIGMDEKRASAFTLVNGVRPRQHSEVSEFFAAPPSKEELKRVSRFPQNAGALPAMDLGLGIEDDVPQNYIAENKAKTSAGAQSKEELLAEIQTIRKSIEALKTETGSTTSGSRRPSFSSRRTLSQDLSHLTPPTHLRPPRSADPRTRVKSMELSTLTNSLPPIGATIDRSSSAPLRDDDWDAYVRDRKLLQPPSGVTAPIPTTPIEKIPVSPAVMEALNSRKQRESALEMVDTRNSSPAGKDSDDVPLANVRQERPTPVTILPPRKNTSPIAAPTPRSPVSPRVRTFEELTERHREKMRTLQAPLTQAEKEHAELEVAKSRWERSKAIEKQAVAKRQAEREAQLKEKEKKQKSEERESGEFGHIRSLSADKLAALPASSKRISTMKVENWQREQQDLGSRSASKRESRIHPEKPSIPFPDPGNRPQGSDRRKSGMIHLSRDPPS